MSLTFASACKQPSHLFVTIILYHQPPCLSVINILVGLSPTFPSACHPSFHVPVIHLFMYLSSIFSCTCHPSFHVPVIHLFMYLSSIFSCTCHPSFHVPVINLTICQSSTSPPASHQPSHLPVTNLLIYLSSTIQSACHLALFQSPYEEELDTGILPVPAKKPKQKPRTRPAFCPTFSSRSTGGRSRSWSSHPSLSDLKKSETDQQVSLTVVEKLRRELEEVKKGNIRLTREKAYLLKENTKLESDHIHMESQIVQLIQQTSVPSKHTQSQTDVRAAVDLKTMKVCHSCKCSTLVCFYVYVCCLS